MTLDNIQNITDRNSKLILELIEELEIPRTLDQLLENFDRLYVHLDTETERIRLLGIERDYDNAPFTLDKESGAKIINRKAAKKKQIQLHVIKKKVFITLSEEDKVENMRQLEYFVAIFNQLKAAYEIASIEKETMSFYSMFYKMEVY